MLNNLNLMCEKNISKESIDIKDLIFQNEEIKINNVDYYYSNSIARASKTMFKCRNEKVKLEATGTEGQNA